MFQVVLVCAACVFQVGVVVGSGWGRGGIDLVLTFL